MELFAYQKAGVELLMQRKNALLADEPGLGKTAQAIEVINRDNQIKSVLVICPASLKINWVRELDRWLRRPLKTGMATGKSFPVKDIVVINYDILKQMRSGIWHREWDMIVCDESHMLKTASAQRTQEVFGYRGRNGLSAKRKLCLTGTPILNRPAELWTTLHWLNPVEWPDFMKFALRYCGAYMETIYTKAGRNQVWNFGGATKLPELNERLRTTLMVRRLKKDVLTELPDKVRQIIELPLNSAAVKAMARRWSEVCEKHGYDIALYQMERGAGPAFTEMAKVRHEQALAKVDSCAEFIEDALESSHKVVVFAHHRDVLSALFGRMSALGFNPVGLHGGTPLAERQAAVDRFQNDMNCRVFIGQIQAAGVGLTLTAASHVIFCELPWTPGEASQAEDRCHRIGQTDSVLVQHLAVAESLDVQMAQAIVAKQRVVDNALNREAV